MPSRILASRTWKTLTRAAVVGLVAGGVCGTAASVAGPSNPGVTAAESAAGPTTSVTGCAIRFTSTGPKIHENAGHDCNGASDVSVNASGDLVIDQTVAGESSRSASTPTRR